MLSINKTNATVLGLSLLAVYLLVSGGLPIIKAHLAQYLLEKAWQSDGLAKQRKPWPGADTFPIAKLTIQHLDYSSVVLHGVSGEALAFGPGHLTTSAFPGNLGNSVIAGHRDSHFKVLRALQLGDELKIERTDARSVTYKVHDLSVVDEHDVSVLESGNETELTLITCYPFDAITAGGPLRYVVSAKSTPQASWEAPE